MNTQIVYVLVSNEKDYYTEQFFISSYSARLYNPEAHIVLLTDDKTEKYLKNKCANSLVYINELVTVEYPEDFDKKTRSRYLKTSVRDHISGDYLFVDTDTIICDDISAIDEIKSQIAAVYDMHVPLSHHTSFKEIQFKASLIGYEIKNNDEYFNSGIMYVKDTEQTRSFYKKWHENYIFATSRGVTTDQQAMLKTNAEFEIVKELPGIWNCQIINNLEYLENAKIVHYYCSGVNKSNKQPPYKMMNIGVCENVRKSNFEIDEELHNDLVHPKSLFTSPIAIISGEDIMIKESLQYYLLTQLYYNHSKLFAIIEKAIARARKLIRKFK